MRSFLKDLVVVRFTPCWLPYHFICLEQSIGKDFLSRLISLGQARRLQIGSKSRNRWHRAWFYFL